MKTPEEFASEHYEGWSARAPGSPFGHHMPTPIAVSIRDYLRQFRDEVNARADKAMESASPYTQIGPGWQQREREEGIALHSLLTEIGLDK